jgi:hypothetical protein
MLLLSRCVCVCTSVKGGGGSAGCSDGALAAVYVAPQRGLQALATPYTPSPLTAYLYLAPVSLDTTRAIARCLSASSSSSPSRGLLFLSSRWLVQLSSTLLLCPAIAPPALLLLHLCSLPPLYLCLRYLYRETPLFTHMHTHTHTQNTHSLITRKS